MTYNLGVQKHFDVIIVGLGAMGSATIYQLAKRGKRVLGIDQFEPPHTLGSSHGETRITRQAIGEGEAYVPLVLRSHEIWRELEQDTGKDIYTACGGLTLASNSDQFEHHGKSGFFERILKAAKRYDIPHEQLSTKDCQERFPQFNLKGDEAIYYEPDAGYVRPENAISTQLELAERYGGKLNLNEQVLNYSIQENGVRVTTNSGSYETEQLVLSTGAWMPNFMPAEKNDILTIYRQNLYWFDTAATNPFNAANTPVFMWMFGTHAEAYFYGFPTLKGETTIKVATGQYQKTTTAQTIDRQVSQTEKDHMFNDFVAGRLNGVTNTCQIASACMYTNTPDGDFIIDKYPESDRVTLISACSGHGFKHSAAIGEAVAEMLSDGRSSFNLNEFSLDRFQA